MDFFECFVPSSLFFDCSLFRVIIIYRDKMLKASAFILIVALIALVAADGDRVLVLYDDNAPVQNTHSIFFDSLSGMLPIYFFIVRLFCGFI